MRATVAAIGSAALLVLVALLLQSPTAAAQASCASMSTESTCVATAASSGQCQWCVDQCLDPNYATCCNSLSPLAPCAGKEQKGLVCPGLRAVMCMVYNDTARRCVDFGCCEYGTRLCGNTCYNPTAKQCCPNGGAPVVAPHNATCWTI